MVSEVMVEFRSSVEDLRCLQELGLIETFRPVAAGFGEFVLVKALVSYTVYTTSPQARGLERVARADQ